MAPNATLSYSHNTMTNNGLITNHGLVHIDANGLSTLINHGVIDSNGNIDNEVILDNTGDIHLRGSATFTNRYWFTNDGGSFLIDSGATLSTSEKFTSGNGNIVRNQGTFLMLGGISLVDTGAVFHHYGHLLGTTKLLVDEAPTYFYSYCGATVAAGSVLGTVTDICADTIFHNSFE